MSWYLLCRNTLEDIVRARVQKWGNSLALRIPKSFAIEAHLEQDTAVDLLLEDGKVTLMPTRSQTPTLEELLAQVSDANLHSEVDTGPATGREVW